jgi:hypothetical protein
MNDPEIRQAFHNIVLRNYHEDSDTLVVDELGLEEGKCRADIAVVNGNLDGYEIKSGADSLTRLNQQVISYNAVFDHSSIILEEKHLADASQKLPVWWGIILVSENMHEELMFETIKPPLMNPIVNNYAVAQLLWREEAQEILFNLGIRGSRLRQKRSILYSDIIEIIDSVGLRCIVREYLKKRQNWRPLVRPSLNDGLCRPNAMSLNFQ